MDSTDIRIKFERETGITINADWAANPYAKWIEQKLKNCNLQNVSVPKGTVCDYCKEPLTDEDYLNEECLKCGETVEQTGC